MATQDEYNAVGAALLKLLLADEEAHVPAMFRGMIPASAAPQLAQHCARLAVDTLDQLRSKPAVVVADHK